MLSSTHGIVIRPAVPADEDAANDLENSIWPSYLWESEGSDWWEYDPLLWVVAYDGPKLIATADGCPLQWDGNPARLPEGWQDVLARAPEAARQKAEWACALGTSVSPEVRAQGLSVQMLQALKDAACAAGYQGMLAPTRPIWRMRMPHLSIGEYAQQRLGDGRHVDPWIRAHESMGGAIIGVSERSMVVRASHAQWEQWLGARLPRSGRLIPDGAAGWLTLGDGEGELVEESVWLMHRCSGGSEASS